MSLLTAKRFPLKQLPTLEVDGQTICQSKAIYRYLANEFELYGSSNMDKAIADQVCETLEEMFVEVIKIYFNSESQERKVWACLEIEIRFCLPPQKIIEN